MHTYATSPSSPPFSPPNTTPAHRRTSSPFFSKTFYSTTHHLQLHKTNHKIPFPHIHSTTTNAAITTPAHSPALIHTFLLRSSYPLPPSRVLPPVLPPASTLPLLLGSPHPLSFLPRPLYPCIPLTTPTSFRPLPHFSCLSSPHEFRSILMKCRSAIILRLLLLLAYHLRFNGV